MKHNLLLAIQLTVLAMIVFAAVFFFPEIMGVNKYEYIVLLIVIFVLLIGLLYVVHIKLTGYAYYKKWLYTTIALFGTAVCFIFLSSNTIKKSTVPVGGILTESEKAKLIVGNLGNISSRDVLTYISKEAEKGKQQLSLSAVLKAFGYDNKRIWGDRYVDNQKSRIFIYWYLSFFLTGLFCFSIAQFIFCISKPQRNIYENRRITEPVITNEADAPGNNEPISTALRNVKIFLASSSELEADRRAFEIFIGRQNRELVKKGIFLELQIWEDFIDAMSQTRLQDEYNKAVANCDIFVSLFFTKVGKYTREEFETAFGQLKKTGKPKIYTYFKRATVDIEQLNQDDINSKFTFEDTLKKLGHFRTVYKSEGDLHLHFSQQLQKLL
jgi:hypothetical protein